LTEAQFLGRQRPGEDKSLAQSASKKERVSLPVTWKLANTRQLDSEDLTQAITKRPN